MSSKGESVVAAYQNHSEAAKAIKTLEQFGINLRALSVVSKTHHSAEQGIGYYSVGSRMKQCGKIKTLQASFWSLLFGNAFFSVPGVGPILVAGPLVACIVGALEDRELYGDLSGLGAGLSRMGIPKNSVVQYESTVKGDRFLLLVNATSSDAAKARDILENTQPLSLERHAGAIAEEAFVAVG